MSYGVRQPAAEREQGGEGQEVGVDRPLHSGAGQAELLLDLGTAMDTMVWSINVIETANIMAARTRFLDRLTGRAARFHVTLSERSVRPVLSLCRRAA